MNIGTRARGAVEYAISGTIAGRLPAADGWLRRLALKPGIVRLYEVVSP